MYLYVLVTGVPQARHGMISCWHVSEEWSVMKTLGTRGTSVAATLLMPTLSLSSSSVLSW